MKFGVKLYKLKYDLLFHWSESTELLKDAILPKVYDNPNYPIVMTPEIFASQLGQVPKEKELVLAIKSNDLSDVMGKKKEDFYDLMERTSFVKRNWCETDDRFIQPIPYIAFYKKIGDEIKVFTYQRVKGSGEKRLLGNYSLGIGGHVNPVDKYDFFNNDGQYRVVSRSTGHALIKTIQRECSEEVSFRINSQQLNIFEVIELSYKDQDPVEVINDNLVMIYDRSETSKPIEHVHLCCLIPIRIPENVDIYSNSEEINPIGFIPLNEYKEQSNNYNMLEQWSKNVIHHCKFY